ncbi:MAG: radical SAM protein [bacterium]|nr:radical SAM protein [bacterium]
MQRKLYDPIERAKLIEPLVVRGNSRKYYRIPRPGRWYGGISTGDCCGCSLRCVFCWSDVPRDKPDQIGRFYTPEEVFYKLTSCARKHNYRLLRISGNEPTISKEHLLRLLELIEATEYLFILETNGTLIDRDFANNLKQFKNLHVRVSLKGTNNEEFSILTGAIPEAFDLQLEALKNLTESGIRCNPAVMMSFSLKENVRKLQSTLTKIHKSLKIEEEYVFLYPHVVKRLRKASLKPLTAFTPNGIPNELI